MGHGHWTAEGRVGKRGESLGSSYCEGTGCRNELWKVWGEKGSTKICLKGSGLSVQQGLRGEKDHSRLT